MFILSTEKVAPNPRATQTALASREQLLQLSKQISQLGNSSTVHKKKTPGKGLATQTA
jgi:hypothetical protein